MAEKRLSVSGSKAFKESLIDYQFNLIVRALEREIFQQAGSRTEDITVSVLPEGNLKDIHPETKNAIRKAYEDAGWEVTNLAYLNGSFNLGLSAKK